MRQILRLAAAACAAALFTVATAEEGRAGWIISDSINEGATPAFYSPAGGLAWGPTTADVGWFYTPSQSYDLWQIATKFAWADGRNVTVDVYNGSLGLPPAPGDSPLRSAVFTPQSDAFAGGIFAPLPLTAGNTYFVEFENVQGLGVNVTNDNGATSLAGAWKTSTPGSSWQSLSPPTAGFYSQPIVQFLTDPATVPEPSSLVLFGIGSCVTLAGAAWRRRREKNAAA